MRLRTSRGVRKRYTEEPIAFDDDDVPIVVPEDRSQDDDFEAQSDGPDAHDDDDHEEEADPTSDEDAGQDDDEGADEAKDQPSQPKRIRNTGAGKIQSRKSFHDIPHYPLETRIVTRVYAGPLRRYARYSALRDAMFGPEYERIKIIWDLEIRWANFPVLPPRLPPEDPQGVMPSPWVPRGFEADQRKRAALWYEAYKMHAPEPQLSHVVPREDKDRFLPKDPGDLMTIVGPWDKQEEFGLGQGGCLPVGPSGLPLSSDDGYRFVSSGAMFNVGSIPLAVAWAPLARQDIQVLAVASIPFSDQELSVPGEKATDAVPDTAGCIQFWEFVPVRGPAATRMAAPSIEPPRLVGSICSNWGRPKRIQFCPVPLDSGSTIGLLAVLYGDGRARIVEAKLSDDPELPFTEVETPIVTIGLSDDYNVEVTCLTWVNTNRLALGHTDGSITLWSIFPRQLLQRVGVHTTYVIDICSAYPSSPYLLASVPVGGCATLTDLSQPSSEFTYFPVPAISFQPNLLCWNETMQGFMALYPSSTPNTTVAFLHHRFFCQARSICTGPNTLTCVSAGATHPFILVGCADGSVFSCNALQKLFKQKGEPLRKLKVMEHEYRPLDRATQDRTRWAGYPPLRGAARVLQGFLPEPNDDPRTEKRKEMDRKKRAEKSRRVAAAAAAAGGKRKGRPRKDGGGGAGGDGDGGGEGDREAEIDERLASRVVIHEPLTRVAAIAWNPNTLFSCWAACAMASGMVKVMDLGVQ